MNADPIIMIHTSQTSTKEGLNKELEGDFRFKKKSIDANKSEHPTGTLAMTLHKPAR